VLFDRMAHLQYVTLPQRINRPNAVNPVYYATLKALTWPDNEERLAVRMPLLVGISGRDAQVFRQPELAKTLVVGHSSLWGRQSVQWSPQCAAVCAILGMSRQWL
jgi:hypothetical protein